MCRWCSVCWVPWGFGLLGYTLAAGVSPHEACGTVYASIYTLTVHTTVFEDSVLWSGAPEAPK